MYSVRKLNGCDFIELKKVSDILYESGKDMAIRYDLHHWNNSYIKTWIIVILCFFLNDIYLVENKKTSVATFQIQKKQETLWFSKLAVVPEFLGKGFGSFCMVEIERIAKENGCIEIVCEVYDKSEHAIRFYEHKGYRSVGMTDTLKYRVLKLRKNLRRI